MNLWRFINAHGASLRTIENERRHSIHDFQVLFKILQSNSKLQNLFKFKKLKTLFEPGSGGTHL